MRPSALCDFCRFPNCCLRCADSRIAVCAVQIPELLSALCRFPNCCLRCADSRIAVCVVQIPKLQIPLGILRQLASIAVSVHCSCAIKNRTTSQASEYRMASSSSSDFERDDGKFLVTHFTQCSSVCDSPMAFFAYSSGSVHSYRKA